VATPLTKGPQEFPDQIDQIRDILVGPLKRQYDFLLDQITTELHRSQEEARKRTDEVIASVQADFSTRIRSLEQEIQQLGGRMVTEVANLQKLIDRSQAGMSQELANGIQRMSDADTAHRNDIADLRSKLQSETRALKEQMCAELEAHVSALRENKVSRDAMAEVLEELAMKIKGVEVIEELKKAARKK
jgi:hypothetical protein